MPKRQKRVFILGGGAALGAHHVGALRYLEEQGIEPDAIIGSSIGVINACVYGSGGVPQLERAWRGFSSLPSIFSPSLRHNPLVGISFFSMDRLAASIEQVSLGKSPGYSRERSLECAEGVTGRNPGP